MSSSKLDEAREKLKDAIQELADVLAPRKCEHGDWNDCYACEYDETEPMAEMLVLTEYVLVADWTRMEDGENFVGVHMAPQQRISHTTGLLHMALYDI